MSGPRLPRHNNNTNAWSGFRSARSGIPKKQWALVRGASFLAAFLFSSSLGFAQPAPSAANDALDVAAVFKETSEYPKAIEVLEQAEAAGGRGQQAKYLARLYYLAGREPQARQLFEELQEKDWQVYLYLGLIHEALGDLPAARSSYQRSIKLEDNSLALYRLAKIHYGQGKLPAAIDLFSRAKSRDSSLRLAYYYLGECFLKTKDYRQAYDYLSKAINFYPDKPAIKEKLATVKEKLGEEFFQRRESQKQAKRKAVKLARYQADQKAPLIRVGLGRELREFTFKGGGEFTISDGQARFSAQPDKFYSFSLSQGEFVLRDQAQAAVLARFSGRVEIEAGEFPFYILNLTYGKGDYWHKQMDRALRGGLQLTAGSSFMTLINILSVEDYLYGVLPAEISSKAAAAALQAQAVAARTLALRNMGRHRKDGFDLCADVHCQVYKGLSAESPAATRAVQATRGWILTYEGEPVETFYHSNCGGCLRADAFGPTDYLVTKPDWPEDSWELSAYQQEQWFMTRPPQPFSYGPGSGYRWQRAYDAQDFFFIFGRKLSDLQDIRLVDKGDCFHYRALDLVWSQGATSLKGDLKIRNYFDHLRSSAFRLEIKFSGDTPQMLIFWGAGFGHGSGLCQEGTLNMAKKGHNYKRILAHYYPKTTLQKDY